MSTPSEPPGTDPEDGLPPQDDPGAPPEQDTDPVTEVIDVGAAAEAAEIDMGERRYTAPGFDAGSTQIIDRVDDHPTEFIATPTEAFGAESRPRTGPQTIPPRVDTPRRRWLTPAVLAIAGLLAAVILGMVLFKRSTAPKVSQEDLVRSSIQTFDNAVQQGDLATLRSITCGQTRDTYVNYDDQSWSDTYSKVLAAKQYPVVASIDEVVVNGDHAEADVTSYMAFDPTTKSTRSFDLQYTDEQWKICQSS
jgi:hypothetical protein